MPTGRVKWFSLEKGFGFIASDEGEDVYLAATALPEGVTTVKPGTKLEFSVIDSRKGPQAMSIHIVDAPACIEIEAGLTHGVKAITDCVWFCIHATDEKDPSKVDEILIKGD